MLAVTALSAGACSPATPPEVAPTPSSVAAGARPSPKSRLDEIAGSHVYDARGAASVCAPPQASCPEEDPDRPFLDRCRLAGFQVRRCGCSLLCSGDASAALRHYDAAGNPADCAPARADCTPPQAPAAFQDACAEKGYRLDTCGCAWLCSGNPRR